MGRVLDLHAREKVDDADRDQDRHASQLQNESGGVRTGVTQEW